MNSPPKKIRKVTHSAEQDTEVSSSSQAAPEATTPPVASEAEALQSSSEPAPLQPAAEASVSLAAACNRTVEQIHDWGYVLRGHRNSVNFCTWKPNQNILATASDDNTVRLWDVIGQAPSENPRTLKHYSEYEGPKQDHAVTCLDWDRAGTRLASGTCCGRVHIWDANGSLVSRPGYHAYQLPVINLKWNQRGDYFLTSGRYSAIAVVWDAVAGNLQRFSTPTSGYITDVDWKTNTIFAAGSTDKIICVYEVNRIRPIAVFEGHTDEVNCVQWDPDGQLLASCSDDRTIKIWSLNNSTCIKDVQAHSLSVDTVRWSPTGPGAQSPHFLASASNDATVRLWDVDRGACLHTLNRHTELVSCIAFSPDGNYIASGSNDRNVYIWCTRSGQLLRSFNDAGPVPYVSWNSDGTKLGVSVRNGNAYILDFRNMAA